MGERTVRGTQRRAVPPPRVRVRIYCQTTYYRHKYVRWLITERSERGSKIPGRWELELALGTMWLDCVGHSGMLSTTISALSSFILSAWARWLGWVRMMGGSGRQGVNLERRHAKPPQMPGKEIPAASLWPIRVGVFEFRKPHPLLL